MRTLDYSITGGVEATEIEVFESFGQATARCSIITDDYLGTSLGDLISVQLGFDETGKGVVFKGYVQSINSEKLPGQYVVEANDILIKAVEHMIVSTDLEHPWKRVNITMEDLVHDLLDEAGITNYEGDVSTFTLATGDTPVEFQFVFAMDAINTVAGIIAWHVYADQTGKVWFKDIKAAPSGAPAAVYTVGAAGNLIMISRNTSTDNLRNKVIVFGEGEIRSEVSAASPYLPAGFHKTAVISSVLINSQWMSDRSAQFNFDAWNKLTETISVEALGDWERHARETVTVTDTFTGTSGDWFVRDITHSFTNAYVIRMNLVK